MDKKILVRCKKCGHSYLLSAKHKGKRFRCKKCATVLKVQSEQDGIAKKSDSKKTKNLIKVNCPRCQTKFEVPVSLMGKTSFCPNCNRGVFIREDTKHAEQKSVLQVNAIRKRMKNCPYCGEEILEEAKKCKHCGEMLNMLENPYGSNGYYPALRNNYVQPVTQSIRVTGLGREIERAAHETKSYVGSAFLTWLLYYLGFYVIGLVMNFVFLSQAKQTRDIIDRNPSGINCLRFLIIVNFVIPLIISIILMILFMTGVLNFEDFMNGFIEGLNSGYYYE